GWVCGQTVEKCWVRHQRKVGDILSGDRSEPDSCGQPEEDDQGAKRQQCPRVRVTHGDLLSQRVCSELPPNHHCASLLDKKGRTSADLKADGGGLRALGSRAAGCAQIGMLGRLLGAIRTAPRGWDSGRKMVTSPDCRSTCRVPLRGAPWTGA